jgi:AMP-activated protein kinase-like protein
MFRLGGNGFSPIRLSRLERGNEMTTQNQKCAPGQNTPCTFRLENVQAASVALVGEFNGWSTTSDLMKRVDGRWEAKLSLPPGRYSYCFFAIDKDEIPRGSVLRMGSTIDVESTTVRTIPESRCLTTGQFAD